MFFKKIEYLLVNYKFCIINELKRFRRLDVTEMSLAMSRRPDMQMSGYPHFWAKNADFAKSGHRRVRSLILPVLTIGVIGLKIGIWVYLF